MRNRLQSHYVPFPVGLMSSGRSSVAMPTTFGREIINMYAAQSGSGAKRNGVSAVANIIADENITELMFYITSSGITQILAATDSGNIYLQNGSNWDIKKTGLNTTGTIRWTHFAGRLIVCNGTDNTQSWDGINFSDLKQFVQDVSTNLTYISATSFSIESDENLYAVGTPVKARLGVGVEVISTVVSTSTSAGVVTIVINDSVLTNALDEVSYEEKPPKFTYVYAAHDRLWGFGSGALSANIFGALAERATVYYTGVSNDENDWYSSSGSLRYINLADKMAMSDELMAMAVKDGLSVFFFRNHTQIWSGVDPTASGDFAWAKTIPVGVVHGNLVNEMPNDVAFFTRFGVRSLSRVIQTEQLDIADLGSEVDPTIAAAVNNLMVSDDSYRKARSFKYEKQGWFGFKPAGESLVYQLGSQATGWSIFNGIFANATAFLNTPDGNLYIAQGGQLYVYDEDVYSDNNVSYNTKWWTPWLSSSANASRWANKYVELITEQEGNYDLTIKRYKDYNSSSHAAYGTTLISGADFWETANWDEDMWDNANNSPAVLRDHFVARAFSYSIESTSTQGPFTIHGFKLYGVQER